MNNKPPHQRAHISKANLVLAEIKMCHAEEGRDPSYLDMIADIEISPNTITKILRQLQAFESLRIERCAGRRNHYVIQENKK